MRKYFFFFDIKQKEDTGSKKLELIILHYIYLLLYSCIMCTIFSIFLAFLNAILIVFLISMYICVCIPVLMKIPKPCIQKVKKGNRVSKDFLQPTKRWMTQFFCNALRLFRCHTVLQMKFGSPSPIFHHPFFTQNLMQKISQDLYK